MEQLRFRRRERHDPYDPTPLIEHLDQTVRLFNKAFARLGVPLEMERDHGVDINKSIDRDENLNRFLKARAEGHTVSGMLFPNQIETIADITNSLYLHPGHSVLVLGAMMCGKTGTAGGTNLLGPFFYLLRGIKYYPVNILPPRKGHVQQTRRSLAMGQSLYQDLRIRVKKGTKAKVISLREYRARASTLREHLYPDGSIDLLHYKSRVLRERLYDHARKLEGRQLDDVFGILQAPRSKRHITPVQELCKAAKDDGFTVVLVIDEPHWGSRKEGVQHRMLAEIERQLHDTEQHHIAITFDATPFQISNVPLFSVVKHRLTADYCGPNCWDGEPIDPSVKTKPILLRTFEQFAEQVGVPDFALINRGAYTTVKAFRKFVTTWNSSHDRKVKWRTHTDYRMAIVAALRQTIHKLLLHPGNGRTRGICIRLMKRNDATEALIADLKLDKRITCIPYLAGGSHESVEDTIDAKAPTGPYVVFVTGAARMADFFPQHCTHFLDWTETVSNNTALMQGSYGRACGYGEPRTVIMNARSIRNIQRYLTSNGTDMMHPGPQCSVPLGVKGAPKVNIRLGQEQCATHPVMLKAFKALDDQILSKLPKYDANNEHPIKPIRRGMMTYVPFWKIFNERTLRYIETHHKDVLIDRLAQQPIILRPGKDIQGRHGKMEIAIDPDRPGYGKIGLRDRTKWQDMDYRSPGMKVKGKHFYAQTSNTGRSDKETGQIQPQLWVRGNTKTGAITIVEIVLRLERAVAGALPDGDILPARTDLHHDFLPEETQLEVEERDDERVKRQRKP